MKTTIPRILLAGTNSGCGKTTVTCAVLQALVNRGLQVGAFKCGPDYINPMFHSRIIGAKSANQDCCFFDDNTMRFLALERVGCAVERYTLHQQKDFVLEEDFISVLEEQKFRKQNDHDRSASTSRPGIKDADEM